MFLVIAMLLVTLSTVISFNFKNTKYWILMPISVTIFIIVAVLNIIQIIA